MTSQISEEFRDGEQDPISIFLYALRAPETKREYPRRLKVFFDYLKLEGRLEQQAREFLRRSKQRPQWLQSVVMQFMAFQKQRAANGEISFSTINNYYKATKLFLEMNTDTPIINWKKITRGIPTGRKAANDRAPTIEELRQQSRQKIRKYIDETLPNEYEKCLVGITSILKEAWNISNNTEADKREKIHALSLAKECYSMKLDLLTNAGVVDDAMKFVSDYSSNNNKHSVSKKVENYSKESKEPSYNDEDIELEETGRKETPKQNITIETTNQVF